MDDIALNRRVLGIHLKKIGVEDVRFAENGLRALDEMKDWTPDLVLSDVWMPEMDGPHLAEAMHADARLTPIPIVAITADVEVEATHQTQLFTKIVAKPVTGDVLQTLLDSLFP